jgi:hypothetical protein
MFEWKLQWKANVPGVSNSTEFESPELNVCVGKRLSSPPKVEPDVTVWFVKPVG